MNNNETLTNDELLDLYRAEHGCECENHVDIKTYKKWADEGFKVKKGEKAIRLHAVIDYNKKDASGNVLVKDGKPVTGTFVKQFKACVFCRCQVEAKGDEVNDK
jgi:hypothetical protein